MIWHVNYDKSAWENNNVNSITNKPRYSLVAADNRSYDDWKSWVQSQGLSTYQRSPRLNSLYLSGATFPLVSEEGEVLNKEFTDNSKPAAEMYTTNSAGVKLLGKPITNIQMSEDGLVSFDFMGGTTGIKDVNLNGNGNVNGNYSQAVYDLSGRLVINGNGNVNGNGVYLVRDKNGKVRKVVSRGTR